MPWPSVLPDGHRVDGAPPHHVDPEPPVARGHLLVRHPAQPPRSSRQQPMRGSSVRPSVRHLAGLLPHHLPNARRPASVEPAQHRGRRARAAEHVRGVDRHAHRRPPRQAPRGAPRAAGTDAVATADGDVCGPPSALRRRALLPVPVPRLVAPTATLPPQRMRQQAPRSPRGLDTGEVDEFGEHRQPFGRNESVTLAHDRRDRGGQSTR